MDLFQLQLYKKLDPGGGQSVPVGSEAAHAGGGRGWRLDLSNDESDLGGENEAVLAIWI